MKFSDYAGAGFTTELLPILPPDAEISVESPGRDNLTKSRGKVPGKKTYKGWFGFARWASYQTTVSDVDTWNTWGTGIGLQGRLYPGLDIDVEDERVAEAIEITALLELGLAPCRFGRGSRRLLVYAGAGFKKRRLAFRLRGRPDAAAGVDLRGPEDLDDRRPAQGVPEGGLAEFEPLLHAVELLGDGQQFVVNGLHPGVRTDYRWRDGVGPVEFTAEGLTTLTVQEVDDFFDGLSWYVTEILQGEIVENARGADGSDALTDQDALLAPSLEDLSRALSHIENDA